METPAEKVTKKYMAETKKLSGEKLQRKCIEWALEPEIWSDYKPKEIPDKPEVVREHEQISPKEKKKLNSDYYKDNPEILIYYNQKDTTIIKNESTMQWLQDMKVYCQNEEELQKVKQKITEFKKVLAYQYPGKYGYIQDYKREFSGDVRSN